MHTFFKESSVKNKEGEEILYVVSSVKVNLEDSCFEIKTLGIKSAEQVAKGLAYFKRTHEVDGKAIEYDTELRPGTDVIIGKGSLEELVNALFSLRYISPATKQVILDSPKEHEDELTKNIKQLC